MQVVYAGYIENGAALAEYEAQSGHRTSEIAQAVSKQATKGRTSFNVGNLNCHCLSIATPNGRGLLVVICDKSVSRRGAYSLLEKLHALPEYTFEALRSACESQSDQDSLQIAQEELEQVRGLMVTNVEQVLDRGERLALLIDRTDQMNNTAGIFRRQAALVSNKMWWQNVRILVLLAAGLLLCAAAIFAILH